MINDLSDLEKFLKLCRKQGVNDIKVGTLCVTFGEAPRKRADKPSDDDADIPTDEPTMEQLMFLSAGGEPP